MRASARSAVVVLVGLFALGAAACGGPATSGDEAATADAAAVTGTQAAPQPAPAPAPDLPPLRDPAEGIDVSHHSGAVDWQRVRADGYAFAYLKATEGVDDQDPLFADNWKAVTASGMARGAYHFYVTEDDPEEQARFFLAALEAVGWSDDDLLPAVDVELVGHGTPRGWGAGLARFLDLVEGEIGVRPMVYTAPNFWDAEIGDGYAASPLWVAEYGVEEPRVPSGFDHWHLWQYEENRAIDGVEKEADVSRVHPRHGVDGLRIGAVRAASPTGDGQPAGAAGAADPGQR